MIVHTISPVYDGNSKILILGSFPSVKSREQGFFYGHPQNRFWKVLASVFSDEIPDTVARKRDFLLKHGVAVWDVIGECDIVGSSDLSIKNVKSNDIGAILKSAKIERIFLNGKTAEKYYKKYLEKRVGIAATCLPSTSPANAICGLEKLIAAWKIIKD
jgi:hypoxanthine-DNA glycosylase